MGRTQRHERDSDDRAERPTEYLAWPAVQPLDSDLSASVVSDLYGTVVDGQTLINWNSGDVSVGGHPSGPIQQTTSQTLNEFDPPFQSIRSAVIASDNPLAWYIPDQETGRFMQSGGTHVLDDVDMKKLQLRAYDGVARVWVIGATAPGAVGGIEERSVQMQRLAWDTTDEDNTVTAPDAFDDVLWTTEEDAALVASDSNVTAAATTRWLTLKGADRVKLTLNNVGSEEIWFKLYGRNLDFEQGITTSATPLVGYSGPSASWVPIDDNREITIENPPNRLRMEVGTLDDGVTGEYRATVTAQIGE